MGIQTVKNREAISKIAKREQFRNHNRTLEGKKFFPISHIARCGRMVLSRYNIDFVDFELARMKANNALIPFYVVFSYQTPIAWSIEGSALHVCHENYSATTAKHKALVREADPMHVQIKEGH